MCLCKCWRLHTPEESEQAEFRAPVAQHRDGISNRSLPKRSAVWILETTEQAGCPQHATVTASMKMFMCCEDAPSASKETAVLSSSESWCSHSNFYSQKSWRRKKKIAFSIYFVTSSVITITSLISRWNLKKKIMFFKSTRTGITHLFFQNRNTHTGCFTTLGHNCRRWFPRPLWSKKFI